MAEWVDRRFDEDAPPPPPEVSLYLKYAAWGDPWGGGWMRWPAREMTRLRYVRNVYEAWSAWKRALADEKAVEWTRQDPGGNRIAGQIRSFRREAAREVGLMERWEKIVTSDERRATSHGG